MKWLIDHWGTISTAASGFFAVILAIDRILQKLTHLIPNTTEQFVTAVITRGPIKATQSKGEEEMKFNFNTFMQNLGMVGAQAAQVYENKQNQGKTLHQVDYLHIGIGVIGAALAAIEGKTADVAKPA